MSLRLFLTYPKTLCTKIISRGPPSSEYKWGFPKKMYSKEAALLGFPMYQNYHSGAFWDPRAFWDFRRISEI